MKHKKTENVGIKNVAISDNYGEPVAYAYNMYSASLYPYQFDEIEINQNIKLGQYGPNKFKNQKINKSTQTIETRLMPNETSAVNNLINTDSNLLAVYISPFKVRDDDILNFLGESDLMKYIGDPNNLYVQDYEDLKSLRDNIEPL